MSSYDRVVTAALAETQSRFALAEALALDIPPHKDGPAGSGESVPDYLAQARQAIIDAGGEPRAISTLEKYRSTAMWAFSADLGGEFRWIKDASFSAHQEAWSAGLSWGEFEALPAAERKVDAIRARAGRSVTGGQPAAIAQGWTQEQRVQVIADILRDPQTAREVLSDPATAGLIARAQVGRAQARVREDAADREQNLPAGVKDANTRLGQRDAQLGLGQICRAFSRGIAETLPRAGSLPDSERLWLGGARDRAAIALAALSDYLDSGKTSLADDLAGLLHDAS
jgi:hypothetical protein